MRGFIQGLMAAWLMATASAELPLPLPEPEVKHTRIQISWEASSAELLAQEIKPIIDMADLAVVHDGKALLYLEGPTDENMKILEAIQKHDMPKGARLSGVANKDGSIPNPPKPYELPMIETMQSDEKLALYGLKADDIWKHMETFDLFKAEERKKALESSLKGPNGALIPLKDLVTIEVGHVKRPLIFKN